MGILSLFLTPQRHRSVFFNKLPGAPDSKTPESISLRPTILAPLLDI
jgi:hypothetical protein